MKSFKDFILEKKKSWLDSSLSFNSSFREVIKNKRDLKESFDDIEHRNWLDDNQTPFTAENKHRVGYNHFFHDHPDVEPKELEKHHIDAIEHYCTSKSNGPNGHRSSGNMNAVLRNMSGDKNQRILGPHIFDEVKRSIKALSSAFTPNNTNRKEITTYGAVPHHIGRRLIESGKNSEHHLAGFTSTSSDKETAMHFANEYASDRNTPDDEPYHIVKYHIKPGVGLSAAKHSSYDENEVILHHGAKITYHGPEYIVHQRSNRAHPRQIIIHHVTVHPEHKSLEEYGQYDHPKD
jgi:hypothetical protein